MRSDRSPSNINAIKKPLLGSKLISGYGVFDDDRMDEKPEAHVQESKHDPAAPIRKRVKKIITKLSSNARHIRRYESWLKHAKTQKAMLEGPDNRNIRISLSGALFFAVLTGTLAYFTYHIKHHEVADDYSNLQSLNFTTPSGLNATCYSAYADNTETCETDNVFQSIIDLCVAGCNDLANDTKKVGLLYYVCLITIFSTLGLLGKAFYRDCNSTRESLDSYLPQLPELEKPKEQKSTAENSPQETKHEHIVTMPEEKSYLTVAEIKAKLKILRDDNTNLRKEYKTLQKKLTETNPKKTKNLLKFMSTPKQIATGSKWPEPEVNVIEYKDIDNSPMSEMTSPRSTR